MTVDWLKKCHLPHYTWLLRMQQALYHSTVKSYKKQVIQKLSATKWYRWQNSFSMCHGRGIPDCCNISTAIGSSKVIPEKYCQEEEEQRGAKEEKEEVVMMEEEEEEVEKMAEKMVPEVEKEEIECSCLQNDYTP